MSVRWSTLEEAEKRRIVETITKRIEVGKDEVEIKLCYEPSPLEMAAGKERNMGVLLPYCEFTLKTQKTLLPTSASCPTRIADHIRKKRWEKKIDVRQAARQIRVSVTTLVDWEHHKHEPKILHIPRIVAFLGYIPDCLKSATIGERIKMVRKLLGLSQRQFAKYFDASSWTVGQWERNKLMPPNDVAKQIALKCLSLIEGDFGMFNENLP